MTDTNEHPLGTIEANGPLYVKIMGHFIETLTTGKEVAEKFQALQDRIQELEAAIIHGGGQ